MIFYFLNFRPTTTRRDMSEIPPIHIRTVCHQYRRLTSLTTSTGTGTSTGFGTSIITESTRAEAERRESSCAERSFSRDEDDREVRLSRSKMERVVSPASLMKKVADSLTETSTESEDEAERSISDRMTLIRESELSTIRTDSTGTYTVCFREHEKANGKSKSNMNRTESFMIRRNSLISGDYNLDYSGIVI